MKRRKHERNSICQFERLFAVGRGSGNEKKYLFDAGHCPYTIEGKRGDFVLYVGVFYEKEQTEQLQRELVSAGIESRVVERSTAK